MREHQAPVPVVAWQNWGVLHLAVNHYKKSMPNVSCVIWGNAANIQSYFRIPQGKFFSRLSF
jgi:hypothetical protein